MKKQKRILSLTLALIMVLMSLAASVGVSAAGSASGTIVFSEDFGDGAATKPEVGSEILTKWNNWINRDYYTGSSPTIITADTIVKDGDNYVAEIKRKGHDSVSNIKSQFMRHAVSIPADTEIAKISFKMRRTDANAKALNVLLVGADAAGTGTANGGFYLISDTYSTSNTINSSRIMSWGTNGGNGSTLVTNRKDQNPDAPTFYTVNQWFDFEITLNKTDKTVSISVDDEVMLAGYAWSSANIYSMPQYIDFGMHYYAYNESSSTNARGSVSDYKKDAAYQIDDVKVVSLTAEDLNAMASVEVDAALLKLSDVTVIKTAENLSLPTAGQLGTTAAISWSSDNSAALANDGTITKSSKAQTAKLTATVSSGSVSKTKVFDVTVLPENVYFYEGFNSVATISGNKLEGYNSWAGGTEYAGYTVDSVFTAQKDSEDNYYGSLLREKSLAITGGYQSRFWELNKAVTAKVAGEGEGQSVSFKLKRDANSATISAALYGPKLNTSSDSSAIDFRTNNHSVTIGGSSYYYPTEIMNDWLDVEILYTSAGTMVYVNGAPLTKADGTVMSPVSTVWNPLTKIGFYPARAAAAIDGNQPTTFMLDDVCIKTVSEDYIACVSARNNLSFASSVLSDLDITDEVYGTTITLDSENKAVISDNGTVRRPDTDKITPVAVTITISKGSESIVQEYIINVAPLYFSKITNVYVDEDSYLDTIYITNYAKLDKAVVLATVYTLNENGTYVLKGVQVADDVTYTKEKGSQTAGFSENLLKVGTNDEIRIFVWKDTSNLIPLAKSYVHEYSNEENE